MKNLLNKILLVALVAVFGGALAGCNPEQKVKPFSVTFKGYGPGYVSCYVTLPNPVTVSYIVDEIPREDIEEDENILLFDGTQTTFYTEGEQQLLDFPIEENKKYYVYLMGHLGDNFSKMYKYEFETGEFEFSQLATVIGVMPDGYKMQIKVPESVRNSVPGTPGSKAIRYTQGDLMIYNFYKSSNDDYYSLLHNAGWLVTEDSVIEYSDRLNYGEAGADINEDGIVDENDMSILWNPIAPGEPIVFLAGEFEWMSEPAEYKKGGELENKTYTVNGFPMPGGWEDGYYLPALDGEGYWNYLGMPGGWADKDDEESEEGSSSSPATPSTIATKGAGIISNVNLASDIDQFWTGAFQRKIFRTRVPAKLDADFKVRVENLKSVNAHLIIEPDEAIYRYLFTVLDDGSYHQMLELLDNKTEYVQWAVTSYFAMYNFGQIQVVAESGMTSAPPIEFNLTDFFYEVPADTKYHVLITGMSGEIGSPQCFKHYTFSTPQKTKKEGPNVVVKALPEKSTPYAAAFNVRCTSVSDNKAERCYYGADYKTGWVYSVNGNSSNTYESLGLTNEFSAEDVADINSSKGLDVYIPTIDGETTRLVVVAYNDENISNGINQYEDPTSHPAVADCTTPYAKATDTSWNPLLDTDELVDDWTMTATARSGKQLRQKVSIKRQFIAGKDYPTTLPQDVFDMYKDSTAWTDEQIKGYFDEFRYLAEDPQKGFNTGRLRNQNKLLLEGWFNDSQNSLGYLSPWDLFKSDSISTVDVASCFARFGPKIYIHVNRDKDKKDSLSISANKMYVSPIADWSIPFYMAGVRSDVDTDNSLFQWSDEAGNFAGALTFPVTLSEDHKTITIHPLDAHEVLWYPNIIGVSESLLYGTQYVLEDQIVSEVVLTKGWTDEPAAPDTPATRASKAAKCQSHVSPKGDVQFGKYYHRNDFTKVRSIRPVQVNGEVITMEKLQDNLEKFRKEHANRMR